MINLTALRITWRTHVSLHVTKLSNSGHSHWVTAVQSCIEKYLFIRIPIYLYVHGYVLPPSFYNDLINAHSQKSVYAPRIGIMYDSPSIHYVWIRLCFDHFSSCVLSMTTLRAEAFRSSRASARRVFHDSSGRSEGRLVCIVAPGNPPGIWTFEDWLVQIPSPRGKKAVQMPHQLVLKYLSTKPISSSIKHFTRFSERDMP